MPLTLIDKLFGKKNKTAAVAKDRLQIIIAQERKDKDRPDYLPQLKKELLEVLSKYVNIKLEDININHEKQDDTEVLSLNINLPENNNSKS